MDDERESVRAYGFIDAITQPDEEQNELGRSSFLIDAIRSEAIEDGSALRREAASLLVIRLMTTFKRLQERFPGVRWTEGTWLELHLQQSYCEPPVWFVSGADNYGGLIQRSNLVDAKIIEPDGSPDLWKSLTALCAAGKQAPRQIDTGRRDARDTIGSYHVRVVDVGQASFTALHQHMDPESKILGYFDVGGPIFFHHHTFPNSFPDSSRVPADGFVVLSHWDFDHYSLAVTKLLDLQNLTWFAPNQSVGPNAAKLQAKLGSRLTLLSTPTYTLAPGLNLWRGTGATTERNGSGYALKVNSLDKRVLLPGDIPYQLLPSQATSNISAMAITHHGGKCVGTPPPPAAKNSVAAVSYGLPNRYHHPDAASIAKHSTLGWNVQPTFTSGRKRGDVWL